MNAIHGGDVWHLGINPDELLDFSANVNPRGLPARALERLAQDAAAIARYPDPEARALRRQLSLRCAVPADAIVIGAGAEALLAPALQACQAKRVLVPVPAFSEYRRICELLPLPLQRAHNFQLRLEELKSHPADAILLNNPHNPTGAFTEAQHLRPIVEALTKQGKTVVLDEAFIDYTPGHSLTADAASNPRLIVIRSLTKFYGCPALRVGYAVSHPQTIAAIRAKLPTWAVAEAAQDALTEALQDPAYERETLAANARERASLQTQLEETGLTVFPSAANYLFAELAPSMPPSSLLRQRLIDHHRILIRNCDSYENLAQGRYIRLAVRTAADNARLVEAVKIELKAP